MEVIPFFIPCRPDNRTDIVHVNADHGGYIKTEDRPLIVTVHHVINGTKVEREAGPLKRLYYRLLKECIKNSLESAEVVISPSMNTRNELIREFQYEDVEVIYNGIRTDLFKPKESTR